MNSERRAAILLSVLAFMTSGCSTTYPDPDSLVLQEPLPGHALVYLIRGPHDEFKMRVRIRGAFESVLPPETYTAVSLGPGRHRVETEFSQSSDGRPAAEVFELQLEAGDRHFLVLLGRPESGPISAMPIPLPGNTFLAVPAPSSAGLELRRWRPFDEAAARPMISIARLAPS